eukprot:6336517-Pyramimonas_sp.AAC.1
MEGSFFDDAHVVFIGKARTLLMQAPILAAIVIEAFSERGLRVNVKPGKPAFMFQFRGPGARKTQHQLVHELGNTIHVCTNTVGTVILHRALHYAHLGTVHDMAGPMGPELAHRQQGCQQAWQAPRTRVLKHTSIERTSAM